MSKKRPLQSMAIVIGPCWTNFRSQKLKRRILATYGFNRTKLHSMFCALFLKNALSAVEMMSFGHQRARRGRYSRWRSLLGHVERIFVHKNERGGYWQYLVSTGRFYVPHSRSYTRFLGLVFVDRIISRRANVAWPLRSWDLTPLGYYLCDAVKYKYYAEKPETIAALKANIREAIGTQSITCLKIGPIV